MDLAFALMDRSDELEPERKLYSKDFLDAGCPTELYNVDTNLDNTIGTWSTNYVIAAVAIYASIVVYSRLRSKFQLRTQTEIDCVNCPAVPAYYFCALGLYLFYSALAFTSAGVGHQMADTKDDFWFFTIPSYVVSLSTAASGSTLMFIGLMDIQIVSRGKTQVGRVWMGLWIAISAALIATATLTQSFIVTLISGIISGILVWMASIKLYLQFRHRVFFLDAMAWLTYFMGALVQIFFSGSCGYGGYEDCFSKCPFPVRQGFGHNFVFHVFAILFFLILSWSMFQKLDYFIILPPSVQQRRLVQEEQELRPEQQYDHHSECIPNPV